jgi:hypothetical protein
MVAIIVPERVISRLGFEIIEKWLTEIVLICYTPV